MTKKMVKAVWPPKKKGLWFSRKSQKHKAKFLRQPRRAQQRYILLMASKPQFEIGQSSTVTQQPNEISCHTCTSFNTWNLPKIVSLSWTEMRLPTQKKTPLAWQIATPSSSAWGASAGAVVLQRRCSTSEMSWVHEGAGNLWLCDRLSFKLPTDTNWLATMVA